MKELEAKYINAYKFGSNSQGKPIQELAYGPQAKDFDNSTKTQALALFFDFGYNGQPLPEYVTGWRFGEIPESGISYNFRDQRPEKGLSIMALDGQEPSDNAKLYAMLNGNKDNIIRVGGWLVGTGSDGEPILALPEKL